MTKPSDPWRARRNVPWALLLPLAVLVLWSCERVEDPQKTNPFEPGNLPDFNLVAVLSAHHDTVSLSWDAVAGRGVRGYRLFRYETSAENVIEDALADVPDTVLTYDDGTIIGGTTYLYKVAALDAAGRTSDVEGQDGVEVQLPARGRIEISTTPDDAPWTIHGPQLTEEGFGDTVYEDQLLGSYMITWLELEGWERPDPNVQTGVLAPGDTLRFSGVFTADLPAAPSDLIASAVSLSQINLSWTDNSDNETGFIIERSATSGMTGFTQIATVGADEMSHSDVGLDSGTQYWYRVRATYATGDSDWSNVATATTQYFWNLDVIAGTINGIPIDTASPQVTVAPGTTINGTVDLRFTHNRAPSVIFPLAATPTWGDREQVYWSVASHMQNNSVYTVDLALTVPAEPDTYYVIMASFDTYTAAQVMSATSYHYGNPVWYNGDDVFDWTEEQIAETMAEGQLMAPQLTSSGSQIRLFAANAVRVVVRSIEHGFVYIPPGTFAMGSNPSEPGHWENESPQHWVTLTKGFYMSKYEVTEEWWYQVMGGTPTTSQLPKNNVSWDMAVHFCNALSVQQGLTAAYTIHGSNGNVTWHQDANGYRLPTEAEWEYACRATTTRAFCNNTNCISSDTEANYHGNSNQLPGCPTGIYRGARTEVGSFQANQWGLFDMHGNLEEKVWCGRRTYTSSPQVDPVHNVDPGAERVSRGGSWPDGATGCRSAFRWHSASPGYVGVYVGFRPVRTAFESH